MHERLTVKQSTDDSTRNLHAECHTRRKLAVLPELEITQERNTLRHRVLAVHRAVHVRNRVAWHEVRGDHLEEAGARRRKLLEADGGAKRSVQDAEHKADEEEHGHSPPWQARIAGVVR